MNFITSETLRTMRKIQSETSITIDTEKPQSFTNISFNESIRFFLMTAQFFGVMPLHNIGSDVTKMHFKWKSIRVLYCLLNAIGAFCGVIFWLIKFGRDGLEVNKTAPLCFYFCTFLGSLVLIQVAKNWTIMIKEWGYVEMAMRGYRAPANLKRKFVAITVTVLLLGFVEHFLFILNGISAAQNCKDFAEDPFKTYFEVSFENYFTVVGYSLWLACLVKFFNTIATFTWIFTDLLITLLSIALTARFRQITLRMANNKVYHEKFLKEIRQDYQRLYHLYQVVQKHLSTLILISFTQNIFFLCIQLYNSLRERTGIIEPLYFFYSFSFLVVRILAVSLYGAWLYEEAQKPIQYLHTVPSEHYSTEVTRLMEQIYINPVAITGSGFFFVTKNFLLQIAGTIVTFELMIFQFAPVNQLKYSGSDNCTS